MAEAHSGVSAGWSGRDFGLLAHGEGNRHFLRRLCSAITDMDLAMGTHVRIRGYDGLFSGVGLSLAIASLVPPGDRTALAAHAAAARAEAAKSDLALQPR